MVTWLEAIVVLRSSKWASIGTGDGVTAKVALVVVSAEGIKSSEEDKVPLEVALALEVDEEWVVYGIGSKQYK